MQAHALFTLWYNRKIASIVTLAGVILILLAWSEWQQSRTLIAHLERTTQEKLARSQTQLELLTPDAREQREELLSHQRAQSERFLDHARETHTAAALFSGGVLLILGLVSGAAGIGMFRKRLLLTNSEIVLPNRKRIPLHTISRVSITRKTPFGPALSSVAETSWRDRVEIEATAFRVTIEGFGFPETALFLQTLTAVTQIVPELHPYRMQSNQID